MANYSKRGLDVALRFDGKTIAGVGFELYQNQPNPFVNKTMVGFHLPEATEATLTVYDEAGRMVYQKKGGLCQRLQYVYDRSPINWQYRSALVSGGNIH